MQNVARLVDETDVADVVDTTDRLRRISTDKPQRLDCLLMDDSEFDRKTIRRIVDKSRYDINLVETGSIEETRNRLAHRNVDILLADYRVPDGNGISFASELVKASTNAPQVIVVTGECDPTSAIEAIRAGAADYLPKADITPDLFDNAIDNAIRARGRITLPDEMERGEAVETLKSLQKLALTRGYELKAATLPLIALGWQVAQGKMITGKKREHLSGKVEALARQIPEMLDDLVIASVCGSDLEQEMETDLTAIVRDIVANNAVDNSTRNAMVTCNPLPHLTACPKRLRLLFESLINASIGFCPIDREPEITIGSARDPSGNPIILLQDNGISLNVRKQALGTQMANLAFDGEARDPFVWSMCQRVAHSLDAALKIKAGNDNTTTVMIRFDKSRLI